MPERLSLSYRARLLLAALGVAAMAVTGCARADRQGAKPGASASAADPMLDLGYRSEWTGYPQVSARDGFKFVDTFGDILAVHDNRNILTAMEPGTGRNRWSLDLGSPLMKFVGNARVGDVIYACSESEIMALDARTGAVKGRQRLAALANTAPLVADGIAVFGTSNGEVLGHNLYTGYKLWAYRLGGTIKANPVMVGSSVGAVSQTGEVILIEPKTGESLGRRRQIFAGLDNHPVSDGSSLYLAGTDQSVWSVSDLGKLNWRTRTPDRLTAQPTVFEGRVYIHIPSAGLTCLDAGDGRRIWENPGVAGAVIASRSGNLIVWDGPAQSLLSLDPRTGDVLHRAELPMARLITTDQFSDGSLYIAKRDASVDKYSPK